MNFFFTYLDIHNTIIIGIKQTVRIYFRPSLKNIFNFNICIFVLLIIYSIYFFFKFTRRKRFSVTLPISNTYFPDEKLKSINNILLLANTWYTMNKIKYLCVLLWPCDDKIKIQRRSDGIVGGSSGACVPFQDIPLRDPFFSNRSYWDLVVGTRHL